ncbi:MAG: helix-turn-helix domain-containing protein [Candidatus Woesearchaeota archaeon]
MIQQLENIGLSPYEAKSYVALLRNGPQKGKTLADMAGIPRTSIYPNLESLEHKGFVTLIQREPKIYKAKDPQIAVNAYVDRQSANMKEKAEQVILASKQLTTINIENSYENIELFIGTNQSYKAAKQLGEETSKELLIIGSGRKTVVLSAMHNWIKIAKRGVNIKIIFENITEIQGLIQKLREHNIQVRAYKFPNMALIISDTKITHYSIKSEKIREKRIVMRVVHEDFAKAQTEFFNMLWDKARKI